MPTTCVPSSTSRRSRPTSGSRATGRSQPTSQGRSPGLYNSRITISAGSADGVRKNDAVVTGPGWLVGHIGPGERARERGRADQRSRARRCRRACRPRTPREASSRRPGIATCSCSTTSRRRAASRPARSSSTTGWNDGATGLRSIYPRGLAIGNVTSSAATDTDLYREIQVTPSADLQSFSTVTVFVRKRQGSGA